MDDEVGAIKEARRYQFDNHAGDSMHYEADEVARCLRDGKLESDRVPLEESIITQGWMDRIRKDGDTVLKNVNGTAAQ